MGTTANYAIPYPELTDPPDSPAQMKALADRIDAIFTATAPVYCSVEQNAPQSLPTGAVTALAFDTKKVDSHGMWSAASPTRLTATIAGTYRLSGGFCLASGAGTRRIIYWYVNGAGVTSVPMTFTPTGGLTIAMPAQTIMQYLAIGDYVDLRAFHDHTAALSTGGGIGSRSFVNAERVGP